MYRDKFVLSILHDGHPVKETGRRRGKEVAIPFNSEYKIRLKNKNDRSCTARVFIDGRKISQVGDVIINAGGTVDLERYIDRSLSRGRKFKFVPIDHPDVDDPTSSNNGVIKVEFRKAKYKTNIKIKPDVYYDPEDNWGQLPYIEDNYGPRWVYDDTGSTGGAAPNTTFYYSSNMSSVKSSNVNVSSGATIEGGRSLQQFTYSELEVDNNPTILRLKIVGIKDTVHMTNGTYKYCTQCGKKIKRVDKYCSSCGHQIY